MMHGCSERRMIPQTASNKYCDKTVPGGRGAHCVGRPRSPARVDRARRTPPDAPPSDGRRQGRRYNRSRLPLAAVPTRYASFRLLTLACRYGMLFGSDCNNNMLWDVTGGQKEERQYV